MANTRGVNGRLTRANAAVQPSQGNGNAMGPPPVSNQEVNQVTTGQAINGPARSLQEGSVHTTHIQNNSVRIAVLEDQLRAANAQNAAIQAQNAELRAALVEAGLIRGSVAAVEAGAESSAPVIVQPEVRRVVVQQGSTFKDFMNCKPTKFKGGSDPLVCRRWIQGMNLLFRSSTFTETQKADYSIRMLEGEALDWWMTVERSMTEEARGQIDWDLFVGQLCGKFCPISTMQRLEREFLDFKKGTQTVATYNRLFSEKMQFASDLCPDEASKVNRYVEGLPASYRGFVRSQTTLDSAMEEARRVEFDLGCVTAIVASTGEKRKWDGASTSGKKKSGSVKGDGKGKGSGCKYCKKNHSGRCDVKDIKCRKCDQIGHYANECPNGGLKPIVCYKCGEEGHIASKCPNPPNDKAVANARARGRAFNMTAAEAVHDPEI